MRVECARMGRMISDGECTDIVVNTRSGADLRACRDCEHGRALQFRSAPAPAYMSGEAHESAATAAASGGTEAGADYGSHGPAEHGAVAPSSDQGAFAELASANMDAAAGAEAEARPALSLFSDEQLWAELHRRHPNLWKRF